MHDHASVKGEQPVGEKSGEKVITKRYLNVPRFNSRRRVVNLRDS